MKLGFAKEIADDFLKMIRPFCLKAEIAGSVRREKPEPNDIEICAIPRDLWELKNVMYIQHCLKGKFPSKYSQIIYQGEKMDIFWCNQDNWGNIFLIRTGPWEFSKKLMSTRANIRGLKHEGGYLWHGNKKLRCPEEKDVFEMLGLPYIKPKNRERSVI